MSAVELIENVFKGISYEYYPLAKAYALAEAQEFENHWADWGNSQYDKIEKYRELKKNFKEEDVDKIEAIVDTYTYSQNKDENKVFVSEIVGILGRMDDLKIVLDFLEKHPNKGIALYTEEGITTLDYNKNINGEGVKITPTNNIGIFEEVKGESENIFLYKEEKEYETKETSIKVFNSDYLKDMLKNKKEEFLNTIDAGEEFEYYLHNFADNIRNEKIVEMPKRIDIDMSLLEQKQGRMNISPKREDNKVQKDNDKTLEEKKAEYLKSVSEKSFHMLMGSLDEKELKILELEYRNLNEEEREKVQKEAIKNFLSEKGELEERFFSDEELKIIKDNALRGFNSKTEKIVHAYVLDGDKAIDLTDRISATNKLDISNTDIRGALRTNADYIDCRGSNIYEINGYGGTKEINCDNCKNLKVIWAFSCEKVSAENTPLLSIGNIYAKDDVEILGKENILKETLGTKLETKKIDGKSQIIIDFLEKYPNKGISLFTKYEDGGTLGNNNILIFNDTTKSFDVNKQKEMIVHHTSELINKIKEKGSAKEVFKKEYAFPDLLIDSFIYDIERDKIKNTNIEQEIRNQKVMDISDYAVYMLESRLGAEELKKLETDYKSLTKEEQQRVKDYSLAEYIYSVEEIKEERIPEKERKFLKEIHGKRFDTIAEGGIYAYIEDKYQNYVDVSDRMTSSVVDVSRTDFEGSLITNARKVDCSTSLLSEIIAHKAVSVACNNCPNLEYVGAPQCTHLEVAGADFKELRTNVSYNCEIEGLEKKNQLKR